MHSTFLMPSLPKKIKNTLIFLILPFILLACGGSSSPQKTPIQTLRKLLPPEDNKIYFGAFTNFTGTEDNVSAAKIQKFDSDAGKPIAWSYFANNWSFTNENMEHKPEIRYPYYNIHQVLKAGKTPFVRLLPWSSPHKLKYSHATRKSEANDIITICTNPSASSPYQHKESKFIATSELQEYLDNGASKGLCFNDFSMQNIIDGDWDQELRQWAWDYLEDTDDEGNPIPLLMTFGVEMNGYWFPWGGIHHGGATKDGYGDPDKADGPERYVDAYRHIIDIFREEGANQVTWFFAPDPLDLNQDWMPYLNEDWNAIKNYYPGDDYIDWIGFTLYGPGHNINKWSYFSDDLEKITQQIYDIASNKPIALLETGAMDPNADSLSTAQKEALEGRIGIHTKSKWFEDFFDTILSHPLNIKALSYWNDEWSTQNFSVDMRINSSPESLTTFQQLISNPRFISELHFSP